MEKLEERIESIVENNGHYPELIASEVKDIAIAFGKEVRELIVTNHRITDFDQLYKDFISNYYK